MSSLLPVVYLRNLSGSHVTWCCIYTPILGSVCLHVMYVRNLSNNQVPWSSIYTLIMESVLSCVLCVRNPSISLMPWRCIYALILEGEHLVVVFVGNCQAVWCLEGAPMHLYTLWQFICDVCKNTLMMSGALKVWSIEFNWKSAVM